MKITVQFFSYLKELAGTSEHAFDVHDSVTVDELLAVIYQQFPRLEPLRKSTLVAVGVEYQRRDYQLHEGDLVSLFPPVQGG